MLVWRSRTHCHPKFILCNESGLLFSILLHSIFIEGGFIVFVGIFRKIGLPHDHVWANMVD